MPRFIIATRSWRCSWSAMPETSRINRIASHVTGLAHPRDLQHLSIPRSRIRALSQQEAHVLRSARSSSLDQRHIQTASVHSQQSLLALHLARYAVDDAFQLVEEARPGRALRVPPSLSGRPWHERAALQQPARPELSDG